MTLDNADVCFLCNCSRILLVLSKVWPGHLLYMFLNRVLVRLIFKMLECFTQASCFTLREKCRKSASGTGRASEHFRLICGDREISQQTPRYNNSADSVADRLHVDCSGLPPGLESLCLGDNDLTSLHGLRPLSVLKALRHLDLAANPLVSAAFLAAIDHRPLVLLSPLCLACVQRYCCRRRRANHPYEDNPIRCRLFSCCRDY